MYDTASPTFTSSNAIGRMTEASNWVNASEEFSYDAMGWNSPSEKARIAPHFSPTVAPDV